MVLIFKQEQRAKIDFDGFQFWCTTDVCIMNGEIRPYELKWLPSNAQILDLGANIGLFALRASRLTNKTVYAVEPIRYEELKKNADLNNVTSVKIIPVALGEGASQTITWLESTKNVPSVTFEEMLTWADFNALKTDCEGGEWFIKPHELDSMKLITGELHYKTGKEDKHGLYNYLKETRELKYHTITPTSIEFIAV